MDISSTRLPVAQSSSALALPPNSGIAKPAPPSDTAAPARDQVSISPQAYEKLAAETATAQAPQNNQPSETQKFVHGALGLERPTDATSSPPQDGYTYGRFASAALTAAALIALV